MKRLAVLILVAACAWAGVALAGEAASAATAEPVELVPRYLLMDARGRAVSSEDFRGRFQLVAFGYTACPDVCPTTLAEVAAVLAGLGPRAERVQAIFITVDPERDTPAALQSYTAFFDPRIVGLSGSPLLVRRAADSFKVRYEKVRDPQNPPERYAVDHSAGITLLGSDGRFIKRFAYATAPAVMVDQIGQLLEAR